MEGAEIFTARSPALHRRSLRTHRRDPNRHGTHSALMRYRSVKDNSSVIANRSECSLEPMRNTSRCGVRPHSGLPCHQPTPPAHRASIGKVTHVLPLPSCGRVPELFQRSQSHGPDRGPSSSGQREIHLLNVQSPLPAAATEFVAADVVRRYHQEEGDSALSAALSLIEAGGHKHQAHVIVGDVAATIAGCARRWKCDQIIMGRADMAQFKGCCWDP